ncbi:hypothetical protein [Aureivirga sp. CE67]|uniref:hypothetical protein n=1 Tax=Aureivirga sp. CE67 TaxID=1788983 RepID=UPI0018CA99BE|nr:hypothetical protein [Aureivirga sp. CE67]
MKKLLLILIIIFCSCSSGKEYVMPFRNLGYSGERLFPIQSSESNNIIRIWVNNGSSIDRIITVSNDSIFNEQSELVEIGLTKKGKRKFFNQERKKPLNGVANFFKTMDSLNLFQYKSQENFKFTHHQPFSLYVVEQKKNGKYNQFYFYTKFPYSNEKETKFTFLEKFIMNEFQWEFK